MIKPSQSIAFYFGTQNPSTGAAVNADSTPTCVVYKNGAVDVAVTPTVTNPATGSYKVVFSVPSGYAAGDIVEVLATATVSSVSSPPTSVFLDTVDTARESETYARLGAPAGASIAADIAAVPSAVWAVGTRTLSSISALAAQIASAVLDAVASSYNTSGTIGAKISTAAATLGAGASTYTVTIKDTNAVPLDGVEAWVTSDLAGATVVASGVTNSHGVITFSLDTGTYYLWCSRGGQNFTNPSTITVT